MNAESVVTIPVTILSESVSMPTSETYGEGYFERRVGSNYSSYGDDPGWQTILNVMASFDLEGTIIEAGGAKGWFLHWAQLKGWDAKGFDISEYAVGNSAPGARKDFAVHDATTEWPYESESADVVCAWEFLEHIDEQSVPFVLGEMYRVLKPGGELWLKTGIIIPADHPFAGQKDDDATHVCMHDRFWWECEIAAAGFTWRMIDREAALDEAFKDRDWQGRFFCWEKGTNDR